MEGLWRRGNKCLKLLDVIFSFVFELTEQLGRRAEKVQRRRGEREEGATVGIQEERIIVT